MASSQSYVLTVEKGDLIPVQVQQKREKMGTIFLMFKKYMQFLYTFDSRYLEFQGTLWNTSRYPHLDISDFQNWEKNNSNNHI